MLDESIKENDEVELMDLFLVLWRRKGIIISIVFFSMLTAVLFITVLQEKELRTEMMISLDFEGIDKGLYPDDTNFDRKDIVSPSVLNELGLDIDLSSHVFAEEVIPKYIKEKITKDPTFVYYPNRFKIVIVEYDEALFDSDKEKVDILKSIANMFRTMFQKKFIEEPVFLFQFSENFIQTNEYDDIIYIFKNSIDLFEEFLLQKKKDVGAFRSKENGNSFSEVLSELFVLQEVDLKNIISKINIFNLARDKQTLIARIKDDIKNIEYERLKNEKMAEMSFDLLKAVRSGSDPTQGRKNIGTDLSNTQFVVDSSVLDKLKENDYLFYLIKLNFDTGTNAINNSLSIAKLKDRVEGLKNDEKKIIINDKEITGQLRSIQNKILEIAQKANDLNHEYLESKFGTSIRINNSPEYIMKNKYKPTSFLLLAFAGSLIFSIFLSFLIDYMIRYRKIE